MKEKRKVYKWVTIGSNEYGMVFRRKVDDAIAKFRKEGVHPIKEIDLITEYDKHAGMIVDKKLRRVPRGKFFDIITKKAIDPRKKTEKPSPSKTLDEVAKEVKGKRGKRSDDDKDKDEE